MDTAKLYKILRETTGQLRKGAVHEGSPQMVAYAKAGDFEAPAPGGVLEIYAMPKDSDPAFDDCEKVDLHFVTIAVGGTIGDQGAAFELFALGKVLGIWDIITPETFGFSGEQARQAAGAGYIMCTGYRATSSPHNPL